jgi:hypothetical protein
VEKARRMAGSADRRAVLDGPLLPFHLTLIPESTFAADRKDPEALARFSHHAAPSIDGAPGESSCRSAESRRGLARFTCSVPGPLTACSGTCPGRYCTRPYNGTQGYAPLGY